MHATSNVGHATVERTLSTQFGVHVNQNTVGGLSLAGVAGYGIAMIEMRIFTRVDFDRSSYPYISRANCAATPKEPVRNHCRIRLIVSVQFPENVPSPVGCKPTISPLNSFPLAARQVKLEENHDATQISKWIFDREKQQV